MKFVFDIETNRLINPDKIWLAVFKNIDTGEFHIFRNITENEDERERCRSFVYDSLRRGDTHIGHNSLGFDWYVLLPALGIHPEVGFVSAHVDTLIIGKMANYPRKGGHSLESYGEEFGYEKGTFSRWNDPLLQDKESELFKQLEHYCIRDVNITHKVYTKYYKFISNAEHSVSITLENRFQYYVVNTLETNGFKFNVSKAQVLLKEVEEQLAILDKEIAEAFPPRLKLIREIHPKETKHGTLSLTDFRWLPVENGTRDLSAYNGGPFCRCHWVEFNPSSHKQLIDVLSDAGWNPVNKTQGYIDLERELTQRNRGSQRLTPVDLAEKNAKLLTLKKYGWKIDEDNLATLPETAPKAAHSLAKRIMFESRRRTLTEWLSLVDEDGRVRGRFQGIGTWTQRMATQKPNMQNIPNEFDTDGKIKYLGKELRQLWQAPRNRLLVGVDAEGIQLRIFAHYINDPEFTDALVRGKKSDKTDPHSLNQRIIGDVCKSRQAAKRFIYALLLGGGLGKLSQILGCSVSETEEALDRLLTRYAGWARLRQEVFPKDARRGYFIGLDGRRVAIPGESNRDRQHLAMSGYLQNGEAVIMKMATLRWFEKLNGIEKLRWLIVNMVHDEWQTEVNNNMDLAIQVGEAQCDALREVGEELNLLCPLAGSYWNDDHHDYTIGTNWYQTH